MKTTLLNFALYQAGWLACVEGASRGRPALGAGVALALVGLHLLLTDAPGRELRLLLAAAAIGFLTDSLQTAAGVLRFDTGLVVAWLAPPWLIVIWAQFATTFHYSMRWLHGRTALAAALGFAGGPLAFYSGHRLGAVRFGEPLAGSLLTLAVVWALALPLLVWIAAGDERGPGRYRGL